MADVQDISVDVKDEKGHWLLKITKAEEKKKIPKAAAHFWTAQG